MLNTDIFGTSTEMMHLVDPPDVTMWVCADAILDVVCSTIQVDSACVAVTDHHDKVFFWAGRGICTAGSHAVWAHHFITWVLSASNHEVTIVEDASTDARCGQACASCTP